ncbi:MAG: hypothetical protein WAM92_10015 [Mycobacterium sp.]
MTASPRRRDVWTIGNGISVLVISSTVHNEIATEPVQALTDVNTMLFKILAPPER